MKTTVTLITLADLLFILLLAVSGSTRDLTSEIIYYLAFIAPIFLCLYLSKERGAHLSLRVRREDIGELIPTVPIIISAIVLFAYLTSLVMGAFGFENTATVEEPLPLALLLHALLPAILEEALFRYVPIRLMAHRSRRVTVLVSALLFALCHTNLFQLPYAFIGGVLLCAVDIAFDSILPSFIIHLLNNSISVVTMLYPSAALPVFITLGALALAALLSYIPRRAALTRFARAFDKGEDGSVGLAPIALTLASLTISISSLFIR